MLTWRIPIGYIPRMRKQILTGLDESVGADMGGPATKFDVMTVTRGTLTGSRWTGMVDFLKGLANTYKIEVRVNSILGVVRQTIHFELSGESIEVAKAICAISDTVNAHNQ